MSLTRIFITGAGGFIGTVLARQGTKRPDIDVVALARDASRIPHDLKNFHWRISDMRSLTPSDLQGIDIVIHAAAKVHDPSATAEDYVIHNEQATRHLAECAVKAGIRRFIFISTIKVNGEYTLPGKPFRGGDAPNPSGLYAISKWKAEEALKEIAQKNDMEWVIVRPPLVYGAGVKSNLQRLRQLVAWGVPLPFGAIENRRSLIGVGNLADAIWQMVSSPQAAGKTFLISDITVSTPELVRKMAVMMHKPARLLPIAPQWLKLFCTALGKKSIYTRICGSLEVDDADIREQLGWTPPLSFEQAISPTTP